MPTQKTQNRNVRKLTKIAGKSFGLTLPIELVRSLGWKAHQKLTVSPKGKKLVVKDWKKR